MAIIDCQSTPYCHECNYHAQYYLNAWNDPDLSLEAKLLWTLISERDSGFDFDEYFCCISKEDALFYPLMELLNKGYFDESE
jgi:hypothetical protein